MKDQELSLVPSAPMPVATTEAPSVAAMLKAVVDRGISQENVGALEKLCDLYERMEAHNAERQFAAAKAALQAEMPNVTAMRAVPNRDGSTRYKFAPFEDIMEQVQPLLLKHGFTVSFSTRYAESRLIKSCTLQHVGGHKETNEFAVRVGGGPPGATETQADGAAGTYAKRFALCDCLNIVIERDSDAAAEGKPITEEEAFTLERMVKEKNRNVEQFLRFAGAKSFKEIMSSRYDECYQMLLKAKAL